MTEVRVDIVKAVAAAFDVTELHAWVAMTHGRIYVDGHCMQPRWRNHWTAVELSGRTLKCPWGEMRFVDGALTRDFEQMELGA